MIALFAVAQGVQGFKPTSLYWVAMACCALSGLAGLYITLAVFADWPLPEPGPKTRRVWRIGVVAVFAAVCVVLLWFLHGLLFRYVSVAEACVVGVFMIATVILIAGGEKTNIHDSAEVQDRTREDALIGERDAAQRERDAALDALEDARRATNNAETKIQELAQQYELIETRAGEPPPSQAKPQRIDPSLTYFSKKAFRLTDLVFTNEYVIRDKVFEDCHIFGPVIVSVRNHTVWDSCVWLVPDFETILIPLDVDENKPRQMAGPVMVSNCIFRRCSLVGVAMLGGPKEMAEIRQQLGLSVATDG